MGLTRGIVFDLDDTLYLERGYIDSGFRAIAAMIEQRCGVARSQVWRMLEDMFQQGVRNQTFDRLLDAHPMLAKSVAVQELVAAYREHQPDIALLPGVGELLATLHRRRTPTALITDGATASQRCKIAQLRISPFVPVQVLTGVWGAAFAKPHPRAFEDTAARLRLPAADLVYVADNPAKDFAAPRRLGWYTVRVRLQGQLHYSAEAPAATHQPHCDVRSVDELCAVLGISSTPDSPRSVAAAVVAAPRDGEAH